MNKELIKQLEEVGFESEREGNGYMCLRSKDDDSFIRYVLKKGWLLFFDAGAGETNNSVHASTFPEILAAIKEHTGVDLTKKTKREEIEELKIKVASLEDAIKSQNDAIDKNKRDVKKFNSNFESYRVFSEGTKDELKERIEQLEAKTKGLHLEFRFDDKRTQTEIKSNKEPNKQASEKQAEEKKGFKVDDRVIFTHEDSDFKYLKHNGKDIRIKEVIGDQYGFYLTVDGLPLATEYDNGIYNVKFSPDCLEHAPAEPKEKAVQFGKYAKILEGHPSKTSYCKGVDVLVVDDTDRPNVTIVMNGHYPVDIHESNLKPL